MWLMGYVLLKMFSVRGLILCVSDLSLLSLFFFFERKVNFSQENKEKKYFLHSLYFLCYIRNLMQLFFILF